MQLEVEDMKGDNMALFLWGHCAETANHNKLKTGDILCCTNSTVMYNQQIGYFALYCGTNSRILVNPREDQIEN